MLNRKKILSHHWNLRSFDTLEALDEPLELQDESSDDNQHDITGEEGINFNIDNNAENDNLSSYAPQEPIELNYDDTDTDESLHISSDYDFDKEINKENESQSDTEEDAYHKAFDVVENSLKLKILKSRAFWMMTLWLCFRTMMIWRPQTIRI